MAAPEDRERVHHRQSHIDRPTRRTELAEPVQLVVAMRSARHRSPVVLVLKEVRAQAAQVVPSRTCSNLQDPRPERLVYLAFSLVPRCTKPGLLRTPEGGTVVRWYVGSERQRVLGGLLEARARVGGCRRGGWLTSQHH